VENDVNNVHAILFYYLLESYELVLKSQLFHDVQREEGLSDFQS